MISIKTRTPFKLGAIATHPIQYQVPWFKKLTADSDIDLTVYFASMHGTQPSLDPGFGVRFAWDIPLLDGYKWQQLNNVSSHPAVNTFLGTNTPGIRTIIRDKGFDAFLIPGWGRRCYIQAAHECFRQCTPLFMRGEARLQADDTWIKTRLKKFLLAPLIRRCSAILSIGKRNQEFYEWCGVPRKKLFDAPYFVDNVFFRTRSRSLAMRRKELRTKWNLSEDATVFLFAGKLAAIKRPMDILHALALLQANDTLRSKKRSLLIVGDGILRTECEALTKNNRLPVSFAGFLNQTEMVSAYCACDCLVVPSYSETWGIVVNEAMACGLPAVVSDTVGCAPDLVENGVTGYQYSMGNIRALADVLEHILRTPNHTVDLGRSAAKRIDKYTIDNAVLGMHRAINYIRERR